MALTGYSRRRRRGRFGLMAAKLGLALTLVGVAAAALYDLGRREGVRQARELQQQVAQLTQERVETGAAQMQIANVLNAERQRLAELQQAYDRDVPKGVMRELNALITERMAAGLSAAELRAAIAAAESAQECASAIERKRLHVGIDQSPPEDGVGSFGDGALAIKISGAPARNGQGQPESWFDASKAVSVQIVRPGGRSERWNGALPLHPAVRLGVQEYRFTITADARGLVQVAMQRCWRA